MPALQFTTAQPKPGFLRAGFIGPPGGGKSLGALTTAMFLTGYDPEDVKKMSDEEYVKLNTGIYVIDTENAAHNYATKKWGLRFSIATPDTFSIQALRETLIALSQPAAGCRVLIIDSFSSYWADKGGLKDEVEAQTKAARAGGNLYAGWNIMAPFENAMFAELFSRQFHVILTMRVKLGYVTEQSTDSSKQFTRTLGLDIIQRDEKVAYPVDCLVRMSPEMTHEFVIEKAQWDNEGQWNGRRFSNMTDQIAAYAMYCKNAKGVQLRSKRI